MRQLDFRPFTTSCPSLRAASAAVSKLRPGHPAQQPLTLHVERTGLVASYARAIGQCHPVGEAHTFHYAWSELRHSPSRNVLYRYCSASCLSRGFSAHFWQALNVSVGAPA